MPSGLQCFDANGRITADLTDRYAKFYGSGSVGGSFPNNFVDIPFPGMTTDGTWYVSTNDSAYTVVGNGSFRINKSSWGRTVYYSVIRM